MAKMPNYYKLHTDGCTVALEPIYTELVPVVHGRWIDNCCYNTCSVCEKFAYAWNDDGDLQEFNYCPNCGARMDGE